MFKSNELIVISGATGWVGRSLLEQIIESNFCKAEQIILISNRSKSIEISNKIFKTYNWENLDINSSVSIYFDLAFQTQDKLISLGKKEFIKENEDIIENSIKFIKIHKPKKIFLASSGAVYGKNYMSSPKPLSTYGELKYKQEIQISKVATDLNLNLLITRIFNISGRNINKFETFALAQMINSALDQERIKVNANHLVFRRYADVNQLIRLILQLVLTEVNCVFDSGGPLVELRELAAGIRDVVNPLVKLELAEVNGKNLPDDYYSRSDQYENLLKRHLGEEPINMEKQIVNTFNYLENFKS